LVSGDDAKAQQVVVRLIVKFGFISIELGGPVDGGRWPGPLGGCIGRGDPVDH
jgi:predicted dinucleotide-binding enzyme